MATAEKTVDQKVEALGRMNLVTLRRVFKETFGKETASTNRDALRKRIANHLRETAGAGGRTRPRDARLPPPKTVLTRKHDKKSYSVTVLEDGFSYRNKTYGSLSTIAKEITGTVWNGFTFFGQALKEANRA